ncbi:MAG: tRNA pseudouridine(55) synthase TruB [Lachnospiraceae bacterium]|nr:tRNA pseudouridine(55) synthase TruB [Lachnospiraceae bacterium]
MSTDNDRTAGINGVLLVNKEKGYTSHDVVAKLRGILHIKKIGHTGTLDPNATGLLPVCIGNATKLCDMLTDRSKTYRTVIKLGESTDTGDIYGNVINNTGADIVMGLNTEFITSVIKSFEGDQLQIPPMYSAIKVGGKKLYELARQGVEIERKAREIRIENIDIEDIDLPYIRMTVECSKGTYIRTLCSDIGQKLNVFGTMASLDRLRVGSFDLRDAYRLFEIEELMKEGRIRDHIIPTDMIFEDLLAVTVQSINRGYMEIYDKLVHNGNPLESALIMYDPQNGQQFRIYDSDGRFCGVYEYKQEKDSLIPVKMFLGT